MRTLAKFAAVLLVFASTLALGPVYPALAADKPASKPAAPPPKIKVGDMAPNFTLLDDNGKPVELSSFRGKKSVALAFYVFAFTGG